MLKFKLLAMLLIVSLSAIVNCGRVTVHDKEVCADLGSAGAECAHTYVTQRRALTKSQWDAERTGWMCMKASDFSDGEDALDELCRTTDLCDYATQAQIAKIKARISPLLKLAKAAHDH